jgi:hypothetical protein
MRTRFDGLLRRLVTLADGVGDRYRDEHGGRRSDPDDQRERAVAIARMASAASPSARERGPCNHRLVSVKRVP